jgi:hypothetical protein
MAAVSMKEMASHVNVLMVSLEIDVKLISMNVLEVLAKTMPHVTMESMITSVAVALALQETTAK